MDVGEGAAERERAVVAHVAVWCGSRFDTAFAVRAVRPAADGSFRFTDRTRYDDGRIDRVRVTGRFAGSGATGTATGRIADRRRDGRVRPRCGAPAATWQLRMRPQPGGPAPPQPGATYHGLTGQRDGRMPHPFLLRVDETGTRVTTTIFTYVPGCRGPWSYTHHVGPAVTIGPDGTFMQPQRYTYRTRRGREQYRVRVDGQFTAGVVHGTLRVRRVVRRSGRVVARCDSGPQTFAAAP